MWSAHSEARAARQLLPGAAADREQPANDRSSHRANERMNRQRTPAYLPWAWLFLSLTRPARTHLANHSYIWQFLGRHRVEVWTGGKSPAAAASSAAESSWARTSRHQHQRLMRQLLLLTLQPRTLLSWMHLCQTKGALLGDAQPTLFSARRVGYSSNNNNNNCI